MSPTTPRSTRASKSGNENPITSTTPPKTSVSGSPKMIMHKSLRNIATKKKHPNRMSETKTQIGVVQEDLNVTRDKLNSPEAWKKQLQKEEESQLQLHAIPANLTVSQDQLVDFSAAKEARLQKLCNTSQDSDCTWQATLQAVQKQHSASSAFLSSAMNEIESLKKQLEMVLKLKAANLKQSELAGTEIRSLKQDMSVALSTIEKLNIPGKDSNKAEACATAIDEIQEHLEISKDTFATCSSGVKHGEPSSIATSMSEEYKCRLNLLGREDLHMDDPAKEIEHNKLKSFLEMEVERLRSAIEVAEIKHQEEQILNLIQIQSFYEFVESIKSDSGFKVSQLKLELRNAESEIMQLKANLVNEKSLNHVVTERNGELSEEIGVPVAQRLQYELDPKLRKSIADVSELKARLADKETRRQNALEENETLKNEISNRERENHRSYEAAIAELEMVNARNQDVMSRITSATKETDNSNRRATKIAEQLTAVQAVRLEMDAQLSGLRIQSDQWRKAAEAAATAIVTAPDNGRLESMGSSDSDFNLSTAGKFMSSPLSDDLDDEPPTRKSISVVKKIGGLWKKSPKKRSIEQYA